jgi:FKBP-type peptidyl-prolyl cis-trans isomerase FklB
MAVGIKVTTISILGIALLAAPVIAQEQPGTPQQQPDSVQKQVPPKTSEEKQNYAMGVEMLRNLRRQRFEVNLNVLIRGMQDSYAGGELAMTEDEMLDSLNVSTSMARVRKTSDRLLAGESNKKAEEQFLVENKSKEGVVTLPSGLQYKVIKDASGKKASGDDTVEINYRGTLIDGTQFDSSYEAGSPVTFRLSDGHVIAGLREALKLMPVGAKWQVFIPARLAYGQREAGRVIGPYSMLIYEIELLAIK